MTSGTSIEQTLFKQIVTGDEVLALVHLFLLKKLLYICTIVTKHLLDLHRVDELKNFVAKNLLGWCLKSRTGIRAAVNHVLESRALERGTVTTEQVQLGIRVRVQL